MQTKNVSFFQPPNDIIPSTSTMTNFPLSGAKLGSIISELTVLANKGDIDAQLTFAFLYSTHYSVPFFVYFIFSD